MKEPSMNAPEQSLVKQDLQITASNMLSRLKEAAGIAEQEPSDDEGEYGLSKTKTATLYRWDAQWWAMTPPGPDYKRGTRPDVPYLDPYAALALVNSGDLVFKEDRINLRLKTLKDAFKRDDTSPTKAAKKATKKASKGKVAKEKVAKVSEGVEASAEEGMKTKVKRKP